MKERYKQLLLSIVVIILAISLMVGGDYIAGNFDYWVFVMIGYLLMITGLWVVLEILIMIIKL